MSCEKACGASEVDFTWGLHQFLPSPPKKEDVLDKVGDLQSHTAGHLKSKRVAAPSKNKHRRQRKETLVQGTTSSTLPVHLWTPPGHGSKSNK